MGKKSDTEIIQYIRNMYSVLELAAVLKHPVMGMAYTATLKDTNPRLLRKLDAVNKSLENGPLGG